MTRKLSQRERVAHLLRANGSRGVHTFELRQAYIGNPSERIADLEREGWVISKKRERLNGTAVGARYVKVSEPDVGRDDGQPRQSSAPSQAVVSPSTGQDSLFTAAVGVSNTAHWKQEAAWSPSHSSPGTRTVGWRACGLASHFYSGG